MMERTLASDQQAHSKSQASQKEFSSPYQSGSLKFTTHLSALTNELSAFVFLKGNRRVIKVIQSLQFHCRAELIA